MGCHSLLQGIFLTQGSNPGLLHFRQLVKNLPAMQETGDVDSIPALGRFPVEGNGNPLQYSCLENPMDRCAWGYEESDMTEPLTTTSSYQVWRLTKLFY